MAHTTHKTMLQFRCKPPPNAMLPVGRPVGRLKGRGYTSEERRERNRAAAERSRYRKAAREASLSHILETVSKRLRGMLDTFVMEPPVLAMTLEEARGHLSRVMHDMEGIADLADMGDDGLYVDDDTTPLSVSSPEFLGPLFEEDEPSEPPQNQPPKKRPFHMCINTTLPRSPQHPAAAHAQTLPALSQRTRAPVFHTFN